MKVEYKSIVNNSVVIYHIDEATCEYFNLVACWALFNNSYEIGVSLLLSYIKLI